MVREYSGHVAQLSTAQFQPIYTPFTKPAKANDNKSTVDTDTSTTPTLNETTDSADKNDSGDDTALLWDQKNPNIFLTASVDGQVLIWDRRAQKEATKVGLPEKTPPWTLSACWSTDGSKIYVGRRNGTVDEWDYVGQKPNQSLRMPLNSGPVYHVNAMPNGKHIIW